MGNYTHKKKKPIRAAAVQHRIVLGDPAANESWLSHAFGLDELDLIVFPESCSSGFDYANLGSIAVSNVKLLAAISALCKKTGKACLLPLLWKEGGAFWNRSFFISDSGDVPGWYDKIHLIGALDEDRHLTFGGRLVTIEWAGWRIGLATCFDLRFPPVFRREPPVDLFLVPALWPRVREEHMQALSQARSIESQTPLLLANATGMCGSIDAAGHSRIYDAKGQILDRLEREEGLAIAQLDPDGTADWRNSFAQNSDLW
ncbi:MAG: hypothetical protein HS115_08100 [Spirochaetales bacterium]|nr:hypothetical protein [Spirochaetales bacterium]